MSDVSKEEVKQFFMRKIKPRLTKLEEERKIVLRNMLLVLLAVAGIGAYLVLRKGMEIEIPLFGGVFLFVFSVRYLKKDYVRNFKQEVIKETLRVIIPNCKYNPESRVSSSHYKASELHSTNYTKYGGEDHVVGCIGGLNMEFSELCVTRTTGSGKHKKTVRLFKGLFFVFQLNKNFNHKTIIASDNAEAFFGKLIGRKMQQINSTDGYELVQLESPAFEKLFVVQSDDQVKARVLLNPSTMQSLTDFKTNNGKAMARLSLSIIHDRLYIAIEDHGNFFEPKLFGEVMSFAEIREIYDMVTLVRTLNDELGAEEAA